MAAPLGQIKHLRGLQPCHLHGATGHTVYDVLLPTFTLDIKSTAD